MLAVLAHHLCTALVPLDVNFAFRTALDRSVVLFALVEGAEGQRDRSRMCSADLKSPKTFDTRFNKSAVGEMSLMQRYQYVGASVSAGQ